MCTKCAQVLHCLSASTAYSLRGLSTHQESIFARTLAAAVLSSRLGDNGEHTWQTIRQSWRYLLGSLAPTPKARINHLSNPCVIMESSMECDFVRAYKLARTQLASILVSSVEPFFVAVVNRNSMVCFEWIKASWILSLTGWASKFTQHLSVSGN